MSSAVVVATEQQSIDIPANPAHVASVRAFVGAIGRHLGCEDETIEELRLVATEACAQALEEGAAPEGIEVRTSFDDRRLLLEVEPCGSFDRTPEGLDANAAVATRRALIEALFPQTEFARRGDVGVMRISVPVTTA